MASPGESGGEKSANFEPQNVPRGIDERLTVPEIGLGGSILINVPLGEDLGILTRGPIGPGQDIPRGPCSSCDILTRPPKIGTGILGDVTKVLDTILTEPKINIPPTDWIDEILKKPQIMTNRHQKRILYQHLRLGCPEEPRNHQCLHSRRPTHDIRRHFADRPKQFDRQ